MRQRAMTVARPRLSNAIIMKAKTRAHSNSATSLLRPISAAGSSSAGIYIPDFRLGSGIVPGQATQGIKVKTRDFR